MALWFAGRARRLRAGPILRGQGGVRDVGVATGAWGEGEGAALPRLRLHFMFEEAGKPPGNPVCVWRGAVVSDSGVHHARRVGTLRGRVWSGCPPFLGQEDEVVGGQGVWDGRWEGEGVVWVGSWGVGRAGCVWG